MMYNYFQHTYFAFYGNNENAENDYHLCWENTEQVKLIIHTLSLTKLQDTSSTFHNISHKLKIFGCIKKA